jgi:hypothetical protein
VVVDKFFVDYVNILTYYVDIVNSYGTV